MPHGKKRRFLLIKEATNRTAYRSLNAIVAQPKNCPFGFNTTNELENITTESYNNVILLYIFL